MFETARAALYPVLPLRDIVVFPHMIVPLFVGREKSVRALEDVMKDDKQILLVTQKNAAQDDPSTSDIYTIGTIGTVLQLLKLPDGTVKVLVEGGQRARIVGFADNDQFFQANAEVVGEKQGQHQEIEALARTVVAQFEQYIKLNKKIPPEVLVSINQIDDPGKLADTVASHLTLKIPEKQELLETETVSERLEKVFGYMEGEIGVLQVEKRIRNRVKRQMEKTQREYYLNEQLKAIQKELGEGEDGRDEMAELEEKINKTKFSKEARDKALAELKKLRSMSPMSAEATVVRNYLDWLLTIPWQKRTKVKRDIKIAERVLNADHFGLEKVKERILEYLAVQQRMKKMKGPILCLVGPPGVGKTSLGKSVARATGRNFVRMSLGGVRDEAEIRGHRRTYIGSMPGKVLQGMKKAKSSNPLFLLDEVDKIGEIAKRHLIPKQVKEHGLKKGEWAISEDALRDIIRYYTREAGVRNLEREIANLTRKAIKDILMKKTARVSVTRRNLDKYAGVRRFRFGEAESEDMVGVTTGLAWTEVGGELLTIEAVTLPGKGRVTATGKLGDVMKESVQAAESYVKARSHAFGIRPQIFEKKDIHVHVPEGATPKDGPSAGVGMVTSIVSVLTGIAVKRDIAMTGEITLRGRVLPIGGLKEKLLAALRGGLKAVLIPGENEKDLAEIPDNVKRGLKIIPVNTVDELLAHALAKPLTPIEWEEESEPPPVIPASGEERSGVLTH